MIIQKKDNEIILEIPILISMEDIDDIMSDILDSSYVAEYVEKVTVGDKPYLGEFASDQISRDGMLYFYLKDEALEDTGEYNIKKLHTLTKRELLEGIRVFLRNRPECITNGSINVGQIDSYNMSEILQYSLFGVIVYE